ncbi:MAG: hypothetical protein QE271_05820 [Bacteriovoracaceae bacterium]|nr:hypothetical protein [Bacteriovoracaceae bacterium]
MNSTQKVIVRFISLFLFSFFVLVRPVLSQTHYLINLQTGDWSGDGHGIINHFLIFSSEKRATLEKLLIAGNKKLGFDLAAEVYEHDDSLVSLSNTKKLDKLFPNIVKDLERSEDGECILDLDHYVELTIAILKLAKPGLKVERVQLNTSVPASVYDGIFNIGGYGLYSP